MQDPTIAIRSESLIATHVVLRNTYFLLSLTLLFSAIMAGVGMLLPLPPLANLLLLLVSFGVLFAIHAYRNSGAGVLLVFVFTGLLGFSLGPTLDLFLKAFVNGREIILTTLASTGLVFLALSGYALSSRRDFSMMGGFLFTGLIVLIVMSLIGLFTHSAGFALAISTVATLLFSLMILYDTSRIVHGGETNYVLAAVALYLDIYNLFINLLYLISAFAGDRK